MNTQNHPDDSHAVEAESPGRRKLLVWLVGVINLFVVVALVGPAIGFVTAPLRRGKGTSTWVPVLDDGELADGETRGVEFRLKIKDGFHSAERVYSIYLHRSGTELVAFDPACPHLGCRVEWQERKKRYFCPCHGGVFNEKGDVESGPPPSALRRYLVKVENGKILVNTELQKRSA